MRMDRPFPVAELRIAHWPGNPAALPPVAAAGGFTLDTCLRRLSVAIGPGAGGDAPAVPPEARSGPAAYQLLLEVTTGLLSAVPGETNVFGQFRRAWEGYRRCAPRAAVAALEPVIARAIRDTREIRQRHLQNIGGASYGPLVRRLLRAQAGERVLLVGAGDLARSMLPFFGAFELGTWNRSPPGAAFAAAGRVFAPAEGAQAADWANHVVMTTPADATNDGNWASWLGASLVQTIVRLGHRRGDGAARPAHAATYDLDDVFELRRSQDNIRSLQLERARHECRERAHRLGPVATSARRIASG